MSSDPGFDEDRLYRVVNEAVRDALFYVIGTVLLVAFAGALLLGGIQTALSGASPVETATGVAFLLVGLYVGGTALGVVPALRELR